MQMRNTMCRYFPFYDNECHCAFSEFMNEKERESNCKLQSRSCANKLGKLQI